MTGVTWDDWDAARTDLGSWREDALHLAGALLDDPVVRAREAESYATKEQSIRTPRGVIGDQLIMSLALLNRALDEDKAELAVAAGMLYSAVPYLWTGDIFQEALRVTVPPHALDRSSLPHPAMWFEFDTVYEGGDDAEGCLFDGILVADNVGRSCAIVALGTDQDERVVAKLGGITYGRVFPGDTDEANDLRRQAVAMLAFVNSPYIPVERRPLERQLRRQRERAGVPSRVAEEIRFVTLRRPGNGGYTAPPASGRAYQHRWVVSGHLRNQACGPGRRSHRLIYVPPYVKGPEDAPMLEKVYRVAR